MKAQMKMFETVGVLVVFFFLLATGSVIYFGAQKSALQKEKVKASEDYAFQIALKSLYMPELDCTFMVTTKENCIDEIKLKKLSKLINASAQAKDDYYNEFGYATMKVYRIYPDSDETTIYDIVPTDEKNNPQYTSKITSHNPILLYNSFDNQYNFGVIEVSVYVQ